MKRKSVFISIGVVLVLLAIYGIWHYSPLRYLTQSKSASDQPRADAAKNRSQPVIVAKKILPEPQNIQQSGDQTRPLVVLKKIEPQSTPEPVKTQVEIEIPAVAEERTPTATPKPAVSASAELAQIQSTVAKKPVTPQPPTKKVVALPPDTRHPYSIMLSSCRLPQSARKIVSDYKKAGLTPYIVKVKFKSGDEWLRVLTGHYQTRREAIQAKKEHRLSGAIVKRTPYTNLIGIYTSRDEMQVELQRIKKLGYSPYPLKTPDGELKLVVGAFVTKKGAENQQAELQAKGIQSTVIIR
ncbi:MAG: SPOR domain-containing protein [Deltaproteobacteria bacterium]|jgi:hypothetical protein|nr:SPOR domain-containing protein [Deltaproteobacteria bacterium]